MAFILAGIIFVGTLVLCAIGLFASGMSDSPSVSADLNAEIVWLFWGGTTLAALIAATHWLPHIGW